MVPYFQALCAEEGNCLLNEYKDFCYSKLKEVLSGTSVSEVDFEAQWVTEAADEFGLDEAILASIYDCNTDKWNTNISTRVM